MKHLFKILGILFVVFSFTEVDALTAGEIRARGNVCPVVELANAKSDGSLETVGCYNSYNEAKQVMNTTANDDLVLIQEGMIIDAKYALIDYDQATIKKYIKVYNNVSLQKEIGYIAAAGQYSDDAAYLGVDPGTGRIKIKVSNLIGYIARYENEAQKQQIQYDIVPLSWAKTPTYYQITSSEIIHHFPTNVYGKSGFSRAIGKKPEMLSPGNYYSYDGHYFYTDMKVMLRDYQNGITSSAVNANNPYYNYYQYLSFRTKTNYNAANLNAFIASRVSNSKMTDTGDTFIDAQNKYGVNAALMFAIGINESNYGTSQIAQSKNNLFGLNAVDQAPGEQASVFKTVADCIYRYAYSWLSYRYLQPGDFRFYGAMVGNKKSGINVKYASDPYWGEKAASHYYQLDKTFGFQDYNAYTIAVLNNDYNNTVYPRKDPYGSLVSEKFYQYKQKDSSIVIIGETTGPSVNGNNIWYQIMSDPDLKPTNLEYTDLDSGMYPGTNYVWDKMKVYVPAAYFTKINKGNNSEVIPTPPVDPPTPTPTPNPTPNPVPTPTPTPSPIPTPPPAKDISSIVAESGYRVENGLLFGIQPGTGINDVKGRLESKGGTVSINSGTIGTGTQITIISGNLQETLSVVIYGDVDGDGSISAVDYVLVKNHIMGSNTLNGANAKAADVNRDGSISAVDYVNIKNYIMGSSNVIQN